MEIFKEYSGKKFKQFLNGKRLIKILNNNLTHNNFIYKIGKNTDNLPFNPSKECSSGGLYFCLEEDIHMYLPYGNKIAFITLEDDCRVYTEYNKFKANYINIDKIISLMDYFNQMSEETQLDYLSRNSNCIKFITNPSEKLKLYGITNNRYYIHYIKYNLF